MRVLFFAPLVLAASACFAVPATTTSTTGLTDAVSAAESRQQLAEQRFAEADKRFHDAEAASEQQLEDSNSFKMAKADVDAKEAKLQNVRRSGTMKERLDASRDFVAAN